MFPGGRTEPLPELGPRRSAPRAVTEQGGASAAASKSASGTWGEVAGPGASAVLEARFCPRARGLEGAWSQVQGSADKVAS